MAAQYEKFVKVYREENTPEYKLFKQVSREDDILISFLKSMKLPENPVTLDVGGREGYISLAIGAPENITIIDPDPTLKPIDKRVKLVTTTIEEYDLTKKYDLIIASHVWGDFGRDDTQKINFNRLLNALSKNGRLIICYNKNEGVMKKLLDFSIENLDGIRYDYFDEKLLERDDILVEKFDFSCELKYETYADLARCCWVLFGRGEQDIGAIAQKFEPVLKNLLNNSGFTLYERVASISMKH